MIRDEALIEVFLCCGRAIVQGFVARSSTLQDSIHFMEMEWDFTMLSLTSLVTKDLKSFEGRKNRF